MQKLLFALLILFFGIHGYTQNLISEEDLIGKWNLNSGKWNLEIVHFKQNGIYTFLTEQECSDSLTVKNHGNYYFTDSTFNISSIKSKNGKKYKVTNTFIRPEKNDSSTYVFHEVKIIIDDILLDSTVDIVSQQNHLKLIKRTNLNTPHKFCIDQETEWEYKFDHDYASRNLIFDKESIYFGSDKGFHKIGFKNGNKIWSIDSPEEQKGFFHESTHDKKFIYCIGTQRNVYKISKKTGKVIWRHYANFDDDVSSQITLVKDFVLFNTIDRTFIALNKKGEYVWRKIFNSIVMTYCVHKELIYAHLHNGNIVVLDLKTGTVINKKKVFAPARVYYNTEVINENLIVSNQKDSVVALDINTLTEKWISSESSFEYIHCAENMIFAHDGDKNLSRISSESGEVIWTLDKRIHGLIQPVYFDNNIYLHAPKRGFSIIDAKKGNLVAFSKDKHKTYTKPLITKDYIIISRKGILIKLKRPY